MKSENGMVLYCSPTPGRGTCHDGVEKPSIAPLQSPVQFSIADRSFVVVGNAVRVEPL
jgi:hypothetical protein